jgi:peptidoglycan/xylan/chitin deacetylase (PgdA/CDA1 family)
VRAILTYHSIDPSGSPVSIDEATLRRHVEWLRSGRVEVVPLERITALEAGRDAVAVTFDNGFVNFAQLAWPLFERHRLPVTLFVASRRVGANNAWGGVEAAGIPTLPLLDWDALKRMVDQGLVLGSHSRTHARLTRASDAELTGELAGSADDIQRAVGVRPTQFCYPYGDLDARTATAAAKLYALACTTELAILREPVDPHRLPRLDAYYFRAPGRLEAWGSGAFERYLWLRACARRLRAVLKR